MTRATAQIVILLDPETNEFRAEMGSPNGSRRKIELPQDTYLWGDTIGIELLELNSWLRDQEERKVEQERENAKLLVQLKVREHMALHRRVHHTSANTRGQGIEFADEKFGSKRDPNSLVISVEKIL